MYLLDILADIHALETELLFYERKYGIRSETFYAAFVSGEEPEDENWVLDFGEWASIYRTWLTRQTDYRTPAVLALTKFREPQLVTDGVWSIHAWSLIR